jgi:energy-coupling factor transport system permease protein
MDGGNLIARVKSLVPVLVPLFVSAFRRAYDIATAMECRCYRGGAGRTRMKSIHMSGRDAAAFLLLALMLVITVKDVFKLFG